MLVVAGCGEPPRLQEAGPDLLFLSAGSRISVASNGASAPSFKSNSAVPSFDWSSIARTQWRLGQTRLAVIDPADSANRWEQEVPGSLKVKIVSGDGRHVALAPTRQRSYVRGRVETKLVVATRGIEPREVLLTGNYEPEAFSTDGNSIFVIKYIPPRDPDRYQVRRLDLGTGEVEGVYTPDAHLQEAMGGTARIQAGSPDGDRLYTLYTQGSGDDRHAFVHVLSLDEEWAHCIDLPDEFIRSTEDNTAITVTPDGSRVYVANTSAGIIAEIDAEHLQVTGTIAIERGTGGSVHAVHDGGSRLFIASGRQVIAVDTEGLAEVNRWLMPETVTGLQIGAEEGQLYVGLRDRVVVLDVETGIRLDSIDPPGINKIDELGPVPPSLEQEEEEGSGFTCAC